MGESLWHKLENQKNNLEQSCTLEQPDTFSTLCFLCYGSCFVTKTLQPKNRSHLVWELEVILCLKCSFTCLVLSHSEREWTKIATQNTWWENLGGTSYKTKRTIQDKCAHLKSLTSMFPSLWELLCGKDHKTKKLIARNLRAWSHSLLQVFLDMSRIFIN